MLQSLQSNFKKLLSCLSMLITIQFSSGVAFGQTTLAEWATSGSHTPTTYSTGNSAWQLNNSQASYNSSTTCGGPFYGTNWSVGAYWQCDVNTTGYGTVKISTVQVRSSGTGPRDFEVQYNNNTGSGWVNAGITYSITSTSCTAIGPFTLPAACNNLADLSIRFTVVDNVQESGSGAIASGGTSYFGGLTLTGVAASFPSVAITNTSPASSNILQGATNNVLQTYNLAVTSATATLSGLTITTAGTYASADITNLKCWYSTTSSFSVGSSTLLSTLTTPGTAGSKVFPSFTSQNITSGTTGYIFITADVAAGATPANTISLGTTAFSNFGLGTATETGTNPVAASNTQTIIAATNCSGTPNAGTASPSPTAICGSGTSLVSLTGGTAASGITYQWSSNTINTSPGTNISGATNASYTTPTVSSTTYYWCTTACTISGLSAISSVGIVSVNPVPVINSITGATSILLGTTSVLSDATTGITTGWTSSNATIAAVGSATGIVTGAAVGTATITYSVTNSSGCSSIATQSVGVTYPYCTPTVTNAEGLSFSTTGGVTNVTGYAETTGVVNKVTSYGVSASPGTTISYTIHNYDTYSGSTSIWLDWNQDNAFGDSTSELELSSQAISASSGYSGSFTVPTTARGGTTFMRLTYGESGTIYTNPCGSATYGGAIDFYFSVIPGISTNPSDASVSEGSAASFSATALAATSYQWQRGISGTYTNIDNTTDGGVYTGYNTTMLNISSVALSTNGYTYRLVATNAAGSATSTAATLTVNVVPPCSGLPAAGTVSVSTPNLCNSGSTTISLAGGSTGTGLTYQWSSSASNTPPGTAITGATSGIYVTPALASTIYYWCTTTCSASTLSNISSVGTVNVYPIPSVAAITGTPSLELGLTTTTLSDVTTDVSTSWSSSNALVATVGPSSGIVTGISTGTAIITYSVTNSGGCTGVATQSVTVTYPFCLPTVTNTEGLSFSTTGGVTNITGYSETTGVVNKVGSYGISARPGSTINYTVTNYTSGYAGDGAIWVDWNQDGVFADSTGEQELVSQSMTEGGSYNGSFTVPTTARGGETVMRVSWGETAATIYSTPCGTASYGAAIDFYVNVLPGITTNPTSMSVNEGSDASFSAVALAATSYQWQRSTGSGYININSSTDGGVYAGYNTPTLLISSATLGMSGYTYQLVATNSVGNATSTVATLTVTPVPPCSGTPNSGSVSVSQPTLCGSGSSILTFTGGSTGTGLTYQWSSSATNTSPGTNIVGATNSIYAPSSISATTYYWCTTTCSASSLSNISTDGTVTVYAIPTITVTPDGGSYCSGTSGLSMTASGATTYVWSPSLGLSTTTGSTVIASYSVNPVTYTVTGTSLGGCTASNTAIVTYYSTPLTPTVTPTSLNVCSGSSVNAMSAVVGITGPATYTITATTGTANGSNSTLSSTINVTTIPAGVTVNSVSVTLNCSANSSYLSDYVFNLVAPNGKILNLVNSGHAIGNFTNLVLSSSGSTPIGTPYTGTYAADAATGVGPSADLSNVNSWSSLYSSPAGTWTLLVYNTTTYTSNAFALTNWSLNIGYSLPSVSWSPTTYLYTNSLGTSGYAGTAANSVYENPNTVSTTIYTVTATNGGCTSIATLPVTVNALPATVASNTGVACAGGTIGLNANATGAASYLWNGPGSYTSSLASPVLASVTTTMTGTYSVTVTSAAGCTAMSTTIVTVNSLPTISAGSNVAICTASTTTLTAIGGISYVWSSDPTLSATTGASVTADPTTTDAYTVTGTDINSCSNTAMVTVSVNALPAISVGSNVAICAGSSTTLTASGSSISYSWTPGTTLSSTTDASVDADPTTTTTYTVIGTDINSCSNTTMVTVSVNALPTISAGSNIAICTGSITTLTATGGISYIWSSDPTLSATTGASVTADPATIDTYTVTGTDTNSCVNTATVTVSVNALPTISAGSNVAICNGLSATLTASGSSISYSWAPGTTLSTTTGASVNATPAAITNYTVTGADVNNCSSTAVVIVSVNALPTISAGASIAICNGSSTTLSATGGISYIWSPGTTLSATTGTTVNADPITMITYTITGTDTNSCVNTATVTVSVNPITAGTISGSSSVNAGSNITLIDVINGGVWSSGNTTVATVLNGVVTGSALGTTTISYTISNSCGTEYATKVITVNVPTISANTSLCPGGTTTLTDAITGGTWSMSSDLASVVGSTGVVTASTTLYGTATVTYTVGGAHSTIVITVNPDPTQIQGVVSECQGLSISLSDLTLGGSWSGSGDITVVGAGSTAIITAGSGVGTGTITYTMPTGCYQTVVNTVKPDPSPIFGTMTVCIGGTTVLSDSTGAVESWTSSNSAIATNTGNNITGISAGSVIVTYMITSGCSVTTTVTVTGTSYSISGNSGPVCQGATMPLSAAGSGTWSSSNTGIAIIGTGGSVTAVSSGTATITYIPFAASGCSKTTIVTVNAAPAISGVGAVCSTGTTTLSDASSGGIWTSGNISAATVGSSTGLVSGVSAGITPITYTTTSGCRVMTTVTVATGPSAIVGPTSSVCVGNTITFTDGTLGGTWSSSNVSLGTVDASGDFAGEGAGTITISYTVGGCSVTRNVTVNALPGIINGSSTVCTSSVVSLTDATTGGVWSISGAAATIGSTGIVTGGLSAGTSTVSYTLSSTGCNVDFVVTVSATAGTITGNIPVCIGSNVTLTDGGGTWASGNTAIATIGSASGILIGESAGTAKITYSSGTCTATTIATVDAGVGAIKGLLTVCQGAALSLSDAATGGAWTSGSTLVATVGTSGIVTGVITGSTSPATASISYTTGAGTCNTASVTVTVNPVPGPISSNTSLCPSGTTVLTDATTGGTWSMSSDYASVVGSTGIVTASSTLYGTATITYTAGGCTAKSVITVNANPTGIGGAMSECAGTTVTLTDATVGGSWSSTGSATASGTGETGTLVAGSTAGTASVTYTIISTGCYVKATNTIYANPVPISGTFNMCKGTTTNLTDASTTEESWTSSNTAVATVSGFHVTGQSQGTSTITYMITLGNCYTTQVVSVNLTPTVSAISGPATISDAGGAVTLSDATAGGTWNSSNNTIIELIAGTSTPTVTAEALLTTGTVTISYTVANGWCSTTVTKSVGAATAPHPGGGTVSTTTLYVGTAVTLDGEVSGAWSSSDNTIATVDGSGLVTAIRPGNVTITHESANADGTVTLSATNVVVTVAPASISLFPNPNKGVFVVNGTVGSVSDQVVTLEVTDVLGQVIYKGTTTAFGGKLNESINLSGNPANGMYLLNVQSMAENKTIHFVIEQ